MSTNKPQVCLGLTDQLFPVGVHICQIVSNDDEKQEALLKFLLAGLKDGERTSCFSDDVDQAVLKKFLDNYGISLDDVVDSGAFLLSGTHNAYFQDDKFEPEKLLKKLKAYYEASEAEGYPSARVIGEMIPYIEQVQGGKRLLEYEAKVSQLLTQYPITTVCQYDSREFDGATIMEVLKVHPYMVMRNSVIHNPFHIPPDQYLAENYPQG